MRPVAGLGYRMLTGSCELEGVPLPTRFIQHIVDNLTLANIVILRFMATQSNNDDQEATALFRRILDPNQCPDTIRDIATEDANILAVVRSYVFKTPEHSELSISRLRTILSSSSIGEGFRLQLTAALEMRARECFGV